VFKKVLFLGAHPDDIEFGASAVLARFKRTGVEVSVIAFSKCTKSLPPKYPPDQLVSEMEASMKLLGVENHRILDFPVRDFPSFRQDILEELVTLQRAKKYDLIIAPSAIDLHQDHAILGAETVRAFQTSSVLHYELTRNRANFNPIVYFPITESDLKTKIDAVACYRSQLELRPRFCDPRNIEALARVRGIQVQVELAEAFEISRLVLNERGDGS
jgi:N-acetylglucosamine malate deacetylase 1